MSKLEILTGRNYLSYSSLSSWLDCGARFKYERVMNAPQTEAWYFLGGHAVHAATEKADHEGITRIDEAGPLFLEAFDLEVQRLHDKGYDLAKVKAGGRKSTKWPMKEDIHFWRSEGPGMVANWIQWRTDRFNEGWQFLPLPDGSPAIEVPVQVEFPEILVKGFIDRVMVSDTGEVHVVDLKSGSRSPESSLQLGIYALGLRRNFGITAPLGGYWMARTGVLNQPTSLLHYTHELVGDWFTQAKRGIEAEIFIPHVSSFCNSCGSAPFCPAVGGSEKNLLDVATTRP